MTFRHVMGNDPRPHFAHQSNLADYNPALPATAPNQGGILYAVIDGLLQRYDSFIDRASAPLVQLTTAQIAVVLAQQDAWTARLASGQVTAWLQDGALHVRNAGTAAADVPLTGTTAGDRYAGQRSGWISTAGPGTWTGTAPISYTYRWQRCDGRGEACKTSPGTPSKTNKLVTDDLGARLRVVVASGNWIAAVRQAISPPSGARSTTLRPSRPRQAGRVGPTNVAAARPVARMRTARFWRSATCG